jgi:hypothetical protein
VATGEQDHKDNLHLVCRVRFEQTASRVASCWQSWNEISLQSVVDVNFSEKWPRIRAQCVVDLCSPPPLGRFNESCGDEIPNPAIPLFTNWIAFDGVQECTGRHPRNRATSSGRGLTHCRSNREHNKTNLCFCPTLQASLGRKAASKIGAANPACDRRVPTTGVRDETTLASAPVSSIGPKHGTALQKSDPRPICS